MSQRAISSLFALCGSMCFFFPLNATPAFSASAQSSAGITSGCDLEELATEVKTISNRTFESRTGRLNQDELRRFAERTEQCPGAELILAQALHSRAFCYTMESAVGEAEKFYKQAIELLEKSRGGESLLAMSLIDLGTLYVRMSRLDDSWSTAQRAIRLLENHAPDQRSFRAKADLILALVHVERAQFSKAKKIYKKVIANLDSIDSGQNADPFLLAALLNYSQLVLHSDPAESRRALDLVSSVLQEKDREWAGLTGWARIAKGRLEYFHGDPVSGLSAAVEGLELARSALPPEHFLLAEFNAAVGELYFLRRNYTEAEALFERAIRTWEMQGTESQFASGTLEYYTEILRRKGNKEAAKAIAKRRQDFNKSRNGMHRANTIDVMALSSPQPLP